MAKRLESTADLDVTKISGEQKIPEFDIAKLAAMNQKNLDVLANASKLAMETAQAVFNRHAEFLPEAVRQAIEEGNAVIRELSESGDPKNAVIRQTKLAKEVFDRAAANAREVSEIIIKSNSQAFDLLSKRFAALFDELKDSVAVPVFGTDSALFSPPFVPRRKTEQGADSGVAE